METFPALVIVAWNWKGKEPLDFNWGATGASVSSKYRTKLTSCIETKALKFGVKFKKCLRLVSKSNQLSEICNEFSQPFPLGSIGLYFLWPAQFHDGPGIHTDMCSGGFVEDKLLFELMEKLENLGMRTVFPHISTLYRTLVSKSWLYTLSEMPEYCTIPTVKIDRGDILKNASSAVRKAIVKLEDLSKLRKDNFEHTLFVCKLGFSWEALDVRLTAADESCVARTSIELLTQEDCYAEYVLLQVYIKNTFELRCFIVEGKIVHHYCAKYAAVDKASGYFKEWQVHEKPEVIQKWLQNETSAYTKMMFQAEQLVENWNRWLTTFENRQLPAIRIDFLVEYSNLENSSRIRINTLELTELGFSMWNWNAGEKIVFESVADSIVKDLCKQSD